jgi:hypothetical protein
MPQCGSGEQEGSPSSDKVTARVFGQVAGYVTRIRPASKECQ